MKKGIIGFFKGLKYVGLIGVLGLGLTTALSTCGGGGGGGGSAPPPAPATVNSTTAPQITSAMGNIVTGANASLTPIAVQTGSGAYCPKTLLKHANDLILNEENKGGSVVSASGFGAEGSAQITGSCIDGGSATLTLTWIGPDNPQYCSQVVNPVMEFRYNGCQAGTTTMDGVMSMGWTGDMCTDMPTAFSLDFANFKYVDSTGSWDYTMNLSMDLSNIKYDANGYIIGGTSLLDGSINGIVDGGSVDLTYVNYSSALSGVKYNASDEIIEVTLTLDGSLQGSINGDRVDERYDNLAVWIKEGTVDSTTGTFFSINGKFDGPCTDGWVTFETMEDIFVSDSSDGATQGCCKISGSGEAMVTFCSDCSLTIDVEGEQQVYTTFDDLEACI